MEGGQSENREKSESYSKSLIKRESGNSYKIVIFYPFYMQIGQNNYFGK